MCHFCPRTIHLCMHALVGVGCRIADAVKDLMEFEHRYIDVGMSEAERAAYGDGHTLMTAAVACRFLRRLTQGQVQRVNFRQTKQGMALRKQQKHAVASDSEDDDIVAAGALPVAIPTPGPATRTGMLSLASSPARPRGSPVTSPADVSPSDAPTKQGPSGMPPIGEPLCLYVCGHSFGHQCMHAVHSRSYIHVSGGRCLYLYALSRLVCPWLHYMQTSERARSRRGGMPSTGCKPSKCTSSLAKTLRVLGQLSRTRPLTSCTPPSCRRRMSATFMQSKPIMRLNVFMLPPSCIQANPQCVSFPFVCCAVACRVCSRNDPSTQIMQALDQHDFHAMAEVWYGQSCTSLSQALTGARQAFAVLLAFSSLARGHTVRQLRPGMLTSYPYPSSEACTVQKPMPVMVFLTGYGKVLSGSEKIAVTAARHREVKQCPVAALVVLAYLEYSCVGSHTDEHGREVPGSGCPLTQHPDSWFKHFVSSGVDV